MSDENPKQWHLEKSVSVGHIVTTVVVVISAVMYLSGLERRLDGTVIELQHQKQELQRVESTQRSHADALSKALDDMRLEQKDARVEQKQNTIRIEDKLDKLIERELGRNGR